MKKKQPDDSIISGRKKEYREEALPLNKRILSIFQNRMNTPHLKDHLEKAGLNIDEHLISKTILNVALFINFILSFYLVYMFFSLKPDVARSAVVFFMVWSVILVLILFVLWLLFYLFLDFRIRMKAAKIAKEKQISAEQAYREEISFSGKKRKFIDYIAKAGLDLNLGRIMVLLFRFAIIVNLAVNAYLFYYFSDIKPGIVYTLTISSVLWTLGFILSLLLLWTLFFFWIDLRIYRRKKEIEEVLPDFLQLTSANISAGMTIDRALWFAVRPRFGILAKEIEDIAKSTLVGENLNKALIRFSQKYDSVLLERSINLLLEGMEAGGEMGELLNRIAVDIQETRIIKKEMAANVTTYVIFVTFATVVAAPFLFGLSTQLIVIMRSILSTLNLDMGSQSMGGIGGMFANISGEAISLTDYRIFAYSCLGVSSTASAVLISIIQKGNIRDGLQNIPIFVGTSFLIYLIASWLMGSLLSGFFG